MKNSYCFFQNKECDYFPCHEGIEDFNCLFCFCPLYREQNCPGNPSYKDINQKRVKVCTDCIYPHLPDSYEGIIKRLKE